MIQLISPDWYHEFADELHAMHSLRFRVFKERLDWNVRTNGSHETDSFDALGPHYLVLRGAGGKIDGCVRMPTPEYVTAEQVAHNFKPGRTEGLRRYTTSKLCNVLFGYELDRRLRMSGHPRLASIRVNSLCPGLIPATGLARSFPPYLQWVSRHILPPLRFVMSNVNPPEVSARRVVDLTVGTSAEPGGRYFSQGAPIRSSEASYDKDKWNDLWSTSAAMTGLPIETAPSR